MRTQEEILARIEKRKTKDILGFEWPFYRDMLTFENAKPFLRDDVEEWKTKTPDEIRAEAIDYMDFAWGKANAKRGISASRSIAHYYAWMWLLEIEIEWGEYYDYGKPQLVNICDALGLDYRKWQ